MKKPVEKGAAKAASKKPAAAETDTPGFELPKRWWIIPTALLLLFLIANIGYFRAHITFLLRPPTISHDLSAELDPYAQAIKGQPDRLSIPALGIEAPIKYVVEKKESVFQTALKEGVVHYPSTANIGAFGNAYIFGHSSDFAWTGGDYKTVFALLTKAKTGMRIAVTDRSGNAYVYLVTGTKIVEPGDLSALDQAEYEKRLLTLQTSYPIGTALRRFIVTAELADDVR